MQRTFSSHVAGFAAGVVMLVLMPDASGQTATASRPSPAAAAIAQMFGAAARRDELAAMKAADTVVKLGDAAAEVLAATAKDRPAHELVWTLRCVRNLPSARSSECAAALVSHPNASVRAEAAVAVAALMGVEAMPLLLVTGRDPDVMVRRRSYDGVLVLAPASREAGELAVAGVVSGDFWIVNASLQILEQQPMPGKGVPDLLAASLAAVAHRSAAGAEETVYQFLTRRAPALARIAAGRGLAAARPEIRIAALGAIATLRARLESNHVLPLAEDQDPRVARAAAECLAEINDPESVPRLVDLLEKFSTDPRREPIAIALRQMTGRLHGYDIAAWRRSLTDRTSG